MIISLIKGFMLGCAIAAAVTVVLYFIVLFVWT